MIGKIFHRTKQLFLSFGILVILIATTFSANSKEIGWSDLIPWTNVFTPYEAKFNKRLDGQTVKIPGYIVPLDHIGFGVTEFMLVPFVGACIHVPPPPPNQLVYVTTSEPWDAMSLWEPVWVTGKIIVKTQINVWAETGYEISADEIEFYDY